MDHQVLAVAAAVAVAVAFPLAGVVEVVEVVQIPPVQFLVL
jgi:hypothetical protein